MNKQKTFYRTKIVYVFTRRSARELPMSPTWL